jgi:hypothetical protein
MQSTARRNKKKQVSATIADIYHHALPALR